MGLPQVWGRVEPEAGGVVGGVVPVMAGGDVGEGEGHHQRGGSGRPSILWTVAYYVLLVAGAVLWYRNLWVLSESGNALVPSEAFGRATA